MKKLFITGIFRTGTSLVSTALNVHPRVTIAWQPYMTFFKELRNKFFIEILKEAIDPDYPMGILPFHTEKEREQLGRMFSSIHFDGSGIHQLMSGIKRELLAEDSFNSDMKPKQLVPLLADISAGSALSVFLQLLEQLDRLYRDNTNMSVKRAGADGFVGIKEVFCEEFIEPLLNAFSPRLKVLHMIRDPRGVLASRNYGKYYSATGSKYPILFIIKSWKRSMFFKELNKHNPDYKPIYYEKLVTDPENEFRETCAFLKIAFDNKMIEPSHYKNMNGRLWQSNSSFQGEKSINTHSVDIWKDILSEKEIRLVEFLCEREMHQNGYRAMFKSTKVDDVSDFSEEQDRFPGWLKKYDFHLTGDNIVKEKEGVF